MDEPAANEKSDSSGYDGDFPTNIPHLLLVSDDIINPMKVVFETAGKVICNKNERLTIENKDMTRVLINIESADTGTSENKSNSLQSTSINLPLSCDCATVSQHNQPEDTETEAAKNEFSNQSFYYYYLHL